jgi:RNA recognition motif-containing protein
MEQQMKIYVGNLTQETAQPQLRETFEPFGEVGRVTLAIGKADGKRKGFGFVEMESEEQGLAAITGLNGQDLDGNAMKVSIARPGTYKPDTVL